MNEVKITLTLEHSNHKLWPLKSNEASFWRVSLYCMFMVGIGKQTHLSSITVKEYNMRLFFEYTNTRAELKNDFLVEKGSKICSLKNFTQIQFGNVLLVKMRCRALHVYIGNKWSLANIEAVRPIRFNDVRLIFTTVKFFTCVFVWMKMPPEKKHSNWKMSLKVDNT